MTKDSTQPPVQSKIIKTNDIVKANLMIAKANKHPSPSGDKWFDDPENLASVKRGIAEMKEQKGKAYSMEEIKGLLGISLRGHYADK